MKASQLLLSARSCRTYPQPLLSLALDRTYSAATCVYPTQGAVRLRPSNRAIKTSYSLNTYNQLVSRRHNSTMNTQELRHFLADSPPSTVNLEIKKHFEALDTKQQIYAHYISR